jgi:fatty-acid desaturase
VIGAPTTMPVSAVGAIATAEATEARTPLCWTTVVGLVAVRVAGIAGLVWAVTHPVVPTLLLAAAMYVACGLSITAGYHRLFAHRTYRATAPVRWMFPGPWGGLVAELGGVVERGPSGSSRRHRRSRQSA